MVLFLLQQLIIIKRKLKFLASLLGYPGVNGSVSRETLCMKAYSELQRVLCLHLYMSVFSVIFTEKKDRITFLKIGGKNAQLENNLRREQRSLLH